MDRAGRLEHAHQLQLRLARLEAVEEPLPHAEDHRGQLEVELVDQPGLIGFPGCVPISGYSSAARWRPGGISQSASSAATAQTATDSHMVRAMA